jgi:thioredoxin 1
MEPISLQRAHRSGRWKKIFIVVGLIVIVAAIFLTRNKRQTAGHTQGSHRGSSQEATLSGRELSATTDTASQSRMAPMPRLIDLGADKCVPCKMMAPILEELKEEYGGIFTVEFIDVWKEPDIGRRWRIRVIPTQIFLDGSGKELYRHEGFFSKEDILEKWKEVGVDVERRRDRYE